jgi:methylmalonyl-CoA/ethylmalonyl-CoA epimerase
VFIDVLSGETGLLDSNQILKRDFMENRHASIAGRLKLKKLNQVGLVVNDIEATARHYMTHFGIGPWYRPKMPEVQKAIFRGREIDLVIDIVLAYCGPVQIELIKTKGKDKNSYAELLERHGEGIHHVGFEVYGIKKKLSILKEMGIQPLQSTILKTGGGTVVTAVYLDTAATGGMIIELIETKKFGVPLKMWSCMMKVGCVMGDAYKLKL